MQSLIITPMSTLCYLLQVLPEGPDLCDEDGGRRV